MRVTTMLVGALCVGFLAACSSPAEKASDAQRDNYKAQEGLAKQRLDLVTNYQGCVKKAGGNAQKVEACDSYLKAAQALR